MWAGPSADAAFQVVHVGAPVLVCQSVGHRRRACARPAVDHDRDVFGDFPKALEHIFHGDVNPVDVADFAFVGLTNVNQGVGNALLSPGDQFLDRDAFHR